MTFALCGFSVMTILTGKYLTRGISRFEGAHTVGGIMTDAYGSGAGLLTGLFAFISCSIVVGAQVDTMGTVLHSLLGVPPTVGVVIGCGVVLLYSTVGGLQSVIAADMVQFILLAVGMPLLLILSLHKTGGLQSVILQTPPSFFHPLNGTTFPAFLSLLFTMTFGEALSPPYTQRLLIGKNLSATAKGTMWGGLFSLPFFFMTGCIGLCARVLGVTTVAADAMPALILQILPIGIRGLVMAAMVSILLSAADGFLNGAAVSLVEDVVVPLFPALPDKTRLRLLRWVNFLVGAGAITVALLVPDVFRILTFAYTFWSPLIFVPLAAAFLGVHCKKAFYPAFFTGFITTFLWEYILSRPFGITGSALGLFGNFLVYWICAKQEKKQKNLVLGLHIK
jgi:SSS family solute:Na+ symporter